MIKIWEFIQTQILGMKWLNVLVGDILVKFGMDRDTHFFGGVQFFFL